MHKELYAPIRMPIAQVHIVYLVAYNLYVCKNNSLKKELQQNDAHSRR